MQLKSFQSQALDALAEFLSAACAEGPKAAFDRLAPALVGRRARPYHEIPNLGHVPYVCLRLPTGGGKTLLAAHAVGLAARRSAERQFPVVLWLVPTRAIRAQTAEALKKPGHPYREALGAAFGGQVGVYDLSEIGQIRPQDLTARTCVVLGTLAALRVNDADGRRLYDHSEAFETHFRSISPSTPGLMRVDEGPGKGDIRFSFANLLFLHRPIVIMDEAHNARTRLTFETLQRINPACVIELTATPDTSRETGSNVLFHVSAEALKAEEMIKLPIVLTEHQNWRDAVSGAVGTRARLADVAVAEPQFVRPICLLQAESRDREVTVEVLRTHLTDNERIEPERIAVATGAQRELDGINLFDPSCKIDFVITVEALKEGWDCSFAYVFGSVANLRDAVDIEQILGRVLRMPYARRRGHDALNRAYAHVSSPNFAEAAKTLCDRLVEMGFDESEAQANVEPGQFTLLPGEDIEYRQRDRPFVFEINEAPNTAALPVPLRQRVTVEPTPQGKVRVRVTGHLSETDESALADSVPAAERERVRTEARRHRLHVQRPLSPAERGEQLSVPRLCAMIQGELELIEPETFLGVDGWRLTDFPAELDFRISESANVWEIDFNERHLTYTLVDDQSQLELGALRLDWTDTELIRWLDRECRQIDIGQPVMLEFLRRLIKHLTNERGFSLANLVRFKFPLADGITALIRRYKREAAAASFQRGLFGPEAAPTTTFDYAFRFDPNIYPVRDPYRGQYEFRRHFYRLISDLDSSGEEFDCAQALDTIPGVRYWVRNIEGEAVASFWLPTSSDRFYPDFVALLNDDRLLVVEYKGAHLWGNLDSEEKRNIGAIWEANSNGKALFVMARRIDDEGRSTRDQLLVKVAR